jgi:hypothetical protein
VEEEIFWVGMRSEQGLNIAVSEQDKVVMN